MTDAEKEVYLNDVILRRLAQLLPPDQYIRVTASLFGNIDDAPNVQFDFPELQQADHYLMLMVEWRRQMANRGDDTPVAKMVEVLQDADIDEHLVCRVCTSMYKCFYVAKNKTQLVSKIEKVPRGIRGEKSSKDMASSRNLVSTIGALASQKMGDGTSAFLYMYDFNIIKMLSACKTYANMNESFLY